MLKEQRSPSDEILRQAMWRELDKEIVFVNVSGKSSIDAIMPVDFMSAFEGVKPIPDETEPLANDPLKR